MGIRTELWCVAPLECPRPLRYCPTCGQVRAFICTDRFRINAQKKSIDVWLNYRCSDCDGVWKYPLLERQSVAALDATLLEAFARHEKATVWKYAFDIGRLRSYVVRVDANVEVLVERTVIACADSDGEGLCVHFKVPFPCDIRLDKLLAKELEISRASLQRLYAPDALQSSSEQRDALHRRIRDGQRVLLSGAYVGNALSSRMRYSSAKGVSP